jgi:hypothetical protein
MLDLFGRLHIDMAQQGRSLVGNTGVRFILTPNDLKVYLTIVGDYDVSVTFHEAKLRVNASVVSSRQLIAHQRALAVNSARYPIVRTEIKMKTISAGTLDCSWDNIVLGQLPSEAFIVFLPNDVYNGDICKEPFGYTHCNVKSISLFADGVQFPANGYSTDFSAKLWAHPFYNLYRIIDQNNTDCFLQMSYNDFEKKPIFPFALSPDCINGCAGSVHRNPPQVGNLRMEARFATPLTKVVNVFMLMRYENMIEVDQYRNVSTDYN